MRADPINPSFSPCCLLDTGYPSIVSSHPSSQAEPARRRFLNPACFVASSCSWPLHPSSTDPTSSIEHPIAPNRAKSYFKCFSRDLPMGLACIITAPVSWPFPPHASCIQHPASNRTQSDPVAPSRTESHQKMHFPHPGKLTGNSPNIHLRFNPTSSA